MLRRSRGWDLDRFLPQDDGEFGRRITSGVTRPMGRTRPGTGMNTVAGPRSVCNSSLANTPPAGPVACRP